jgi:hypothetical protein
MFFLFGSDSLIFEVQNRADMKHNIVIFHIGTAYYTLTPCGCLGQASLSPATA